MVYSYRLLVSDTHTFDSGISFGTIFLNSSVRLPLVVVRLTVPIFLELAVLFFQVVGPVVVYFIEETDSASGSLIDLIVQILTAYDTRSISVNHMIPIPRLREDSMGVVSVHGQFSFNQCLTMYHATASSFELIVILE